ncbi:MAG TPA: SH3 domain-containing protein [Candidatus Eisenbacteria bacterium]|nr:SH3 domain-containing protein [Candidatus Eisenbacteria bacterium]
MIKSVFTAHLSKYDQEDLTLLINDRSLGLLSAEEKSNFVSTSSRDIHMVSGFSNKSIYYDPRFNKDRIKLWNQAFKEMQSHGLKAFPQFIYDHHIYAEYLYLFSAEIFIGWQDRQNGLYLLRDGSLYRVQPTIMPPNVFARDWMSHADFYSFVLKSKDVVFSISDKVFDRIDPTKAEKSLRENIKLSNSMNQIMNNLRVYYSDLDLSWIGFEIERIDKNVFKKDKEGIRHMDENGTYLKSNKDFTSLINSSRVSRVKDGQKLIPAPKAVKAKSDQRADDYSKEAAVNQIKKKRTNRLKFNRSKSIEVSRDKADDIEDIERKIRKKNIEKLENSRTSKDIFWDDVRGFSFEPIISNLKYSLKNFFNIIPKRPFLSKLVATTIILLVIVFVFLFGRMIGSRDENTREIAVQETTFETKIMQIDDEVIPPDSALLEIDITVKANNLQIRQKPDADSAIVATVQRGAKLTQLSEPESNWVFVRLADGKTVGYAYADSLFSE